MATSVVACKRRREESLNGEKNEGERMLLNHGIIVRVPRWDKSRIKLHITTHVRLFIGCRGRERTNRCCHNPGRRVKAISISARLTCKSCFAASAPALVLNVTKPTGWREDRRKRGFMFNERQSRNILMNIPKQSFHSCWSLSIAILRSLHKLWTISTTHAALHPSGGH